MFASGAVRGWEIAWLQIDDRVRGDRPPRLVGEKHFLPQPASGWTQASGIFQNAPQSGHARVSEGR